MDDSNNKVAKIEEKIVNHISSGFSKIMFNKWSMPNTHTQAHSQGTSGEVESSAARNDAEVREGGLSWVLPLMAGRAHVTFSASSGIRLLSSNPASATCEEAALVTND